MSVDASTLRFFESIRLDGGNGNNAWIEQQLLSELPSIATGIRWPGEPTGCKLADIGNYLVRVLHILAAFATNILEGDSIPDYIESRAPDLFNEPDLHTANQLDNKHDALKQISSKLMQALKDCESVWTFAIPQEDPLIPYQSLDPTGYSFPEYQTSEHPSIDNFARSSTAMHPPGYSMQAQQSSSSDANTLGDGSLTSQAETGATDYLASIDDQHDATSPGSWRASDSGPSPQNLVDDNSGVPLLEQLRSRGKGHYTCPRGHDCKKGGVQSNGELTIFERNSTFRAHLQLHERPYTCDLPGCPNKKGFARIDQLERHKKKVQHHTPGWVYERDG